MDLSNLYSDINRRGCTAIQNDNVRIDEYLTEKKTDQRLGLTLLTSLPAHICRNIDICLQAFKRLEPKQYYYSAAQMHITIIDIIAANSKFCLSPLEKKKYMEILTQIISEVGTIHWKLQGLIVSPDAILAKGYYSDNLVKLRNLIRHEVPLSGLPFQERYPTNSGHVTVARFISPIQHPHQFLSLQENVNNIDLGSFSTPIIDLVVHDWYNYHPQLLSTIAINN
ncbi:hypothetical protein H5S09_01675 [Limosilactobacillus sp. STM2_1]|uniref:Uncharacterized protein n=1 Tax=Limosilactobacillus rudii TaxID=2759755 RepID=A0A7W3UJF0_9LACO|nr:hypothetical protein [Limosilactobacillus rudii]MBB1080152.1 hypothetical protein [Limosilactobacillus rudii]MBB1096667.1 hypothetical protein [Limosilactobacillus rudii]MCD7133640.1 hypothetical protein [Limosilactobacillus rudii]